MSVPQWDYILNDVSQNESLLDQKSQQVVTIVPAAAQLQDQVPVNENACDKRQHGFFNHLQLLFCQSDRNKPNTILQQHQHHHHHHHHRYRSSHYSSRRLRKRVVLKHGDCNIVLENVAKRRRKYLQDIFTTLVDAQWRWTLFVFAMNFVLSWLVFAIIWWVIAYAHEDLLPEHLPGASNATDWQPCATNIHSFVSCFLLSVETQHTIGYGGRMVTEECPEAVFIMCLQSITGVFIQAFMVGIVFAKLSRPKKRTQTLLFSRNAVICHRDGQLCLMFRVGDMRKSHIIEAHVRAQLIRQKVTREGEQLPFYQQELQVGCDGEEDKLFFIWPTTVVHIINSQSPLYKLSAPDLLTERFEIVVLLEGVIESTGMTTQARSSYLPSEILWGHRFESIITFKRELGQYEVNYTLFNNTHEVDTPLCSAKQLDEHRAAYNNNDHKHIDHLTPGQFNVPLNHPHRSASSDTLDGSSVESLSMDEHIIMVARPSSNNDNHLLPTSSNSNGQKTTTIPICKITSADSTPEKS